eukprot:Gb_14732 [translate_table: standard]
MSIAFNSSRDRGVDKLSRISLLSQAPPFKHRMRIGVKAVASLPSMVGGKAVNFYRDYPQANDLGGASRIIAANHCLVDPFSFGCCCFKGKYTSMQGSNAWDFLCNVSEQQASDPLKVFIEAVNRAGKFLTSEDDREKIMLELPKAIQKTSLLLAVLAVE